MRAQRPPAEAIRWFTFRERISPSLWFVPGVFAVGAFASSRCTVWLDRYLESTKPPGWMITADAGASAALTATAATAMLSFVAVVFSTTLVAIQLAGGQYSPRAVRIFVRSRLTHVTLGLFLATFMFALNGLVEVRSRSGTIVPAVTVTAVYLLLLATIAAFIAFVHGMSKILRVQYLLTKIVDDGRPTLDEAFPPDSSYLDVTDQAPPHGAPVVRSRRRTGVVQAIDRHGLVEYARIRNLRVELLVEAGEYVGVGTPIAHVSGPSPDGDAIARWFLLGTERTLVQDPGFVLRQLVDVASRALSPAVNDPTTAVQAIDRITDLLGSVVDRADPAACYVDERGTARLWTREPGIARLLQLGYVEIIRYGADAPQVVRRLRASFDVLEGLARADLGPAIAGLRDLLDRAVAAAMPPALQDVARRADRHGLG
ncbi:MAG: DUF2254 domain-containing protein [Acidimicrobiales bacterium]